MAHENPSTIGKSIRQARLAAGLSQHRLAIALDTTPTTISRWERGEHAPTVATLRRVAEALGVKLSTLIGD